MTTPDLAFPARNSHLSSSQVHLLSTSSSVSHLFIFLSPKPVACCCPPPLHLSHPVYHYIIYHLEPTLSVYTTKIYTAEFVRIFFLFMRDVSCLSIKGPGREMPFSFVASKVMLCMDVQTANKGTESRCGLQPAVCRRSLENVGSMRSGAFPVLVNSVSPSWGRENLRIVFELKSAGGTLYFTQDAERKIIPGI